VWRKGKTPSQGHRSTSGQRVDYPHEFSAEQNPERQLDGVEVDTLFTDSSSGKSTTRPQLQAGSMWRPTHPATTVTEHSAGPAREACPNSAHDRLCVDRPCQNAQMPPHPVDLAEKLSLFSERWSPKVVARLNDYEIKVVKVEGEFVWHTHADTDELFLVIDGELTIQLRDGNVHLRPGQLFVVPRGIEHCPIAKGEAHAMLIEPVGVVNTGDAGGSLTATYDGVE
jgi:mannose-6-phosphate isomerase-like protein (cupin superfamily)